MPEVPYLVQTATQARHFATSEMLREVKSAIDRDGFWQEEEEWRISTLMTRRIEPVAAHGQRWFEVTVTCDTEMICHAPTLERALEYMFVFDRMVMDLFWTLGWPSWATKSRMEPQHGDTLP